MSADLDKKERADQPEANHQTRGIERVVIPQVVLEGAGVKLKRSIATRELDYVDPFLLFDHFGSDNPAEYLAGFPMHPHRGIETVTYMLAGVVRHKDSIGNSGTIGAGDVQWMTSGRGIMHEEMPAPVDGKMAGFQLWVNLPAKLKMSPPRYQEIAADEVPVVQHDDGVRVRVVAGTANGTRGPVTEIAADPIYLDVTVPANQSFARRVQRGHSVFAYVFEGSGLFGKVSQGQGQEVTHPRLVVFADGDRIEVQTANEPARFLLVSGKPLNEPIARYGPFVMNTPEEIQQALRDLRNGTFVR
jgi:redox-sensitive bicupin YhaK (pirin superfamily)